MIKQALKKQKWFRLLFAKPLKWRSDWLDRSAIAQRSFYNHTVVGGVLLLRPSNFRSQFRIHAKSDVARRVVLEGAYEPELLETIRVAWRGPGNIVNVGANVGFWAIEVVRMLEGVEKVFAIEPNPEAYKLLSENIEINGLADRVVPIQACVAETEGVVSFETIEGKPEYSSIGGIVHTAVCDLPKVTISIHAKPLDKIVEADAVKLLIVDTEGADYLVLSGAREFIKRHRPTIIFETCESLLNKFGHSVRGLRLLLEELGYVVRKAGDLEQTVADGIDGEAVAFPREKLPGFLNKAASSDPTHARLEMDAGVREPAHS